MINYASNNIPLNSVFLGIGTNLGDKKKNIELAFDKIEGQIGNITSISALYLSKPQGFDSENLFVNCAIHIQTPLKPTEVLSETQSIEKIWGERINQRILDMPIELLILIFCFTIILL